MKKRANTLPAGAGLPAVSTEVPSGDHLPTYRPSSGRDKLRSTPDTIHTASPRGLGRKATSDPRRGGAGSPATQEEGWRRLRPAVILDMVLDKRRRGSWPRKLRWSWVTRTDARKRRVPLLRDARGRLWETRLGHGARHVRRWQG